MSLWSWLGVAETRAITAENPTGARGGGAHSVPPPHYGASEMGKGWKAKPCVSLLPRQVTTIAEIEGPGVIQHIWFTSHAETLHDCTLNIFWDGAKTPAVSMSVADFFCNLMGLRSLFASIPVVVAPHGGLNCFWPMPFRRSARITVENPSEEKRTGFFYQVTYALAEVPRGAGRFYASRHEGRAPTSLLWACQGAGHLVGMVVGQRGEPHVVSQTELAFDLDGEAACRQSAGSYFGIARDRLDFVTAYQGSMWPPVDGASVHIGYRWHILNPLRHQRSLRVRLRSPQGSSVCAVVMGYVRDADVLSEATTPK